MTTNPYEGLSGAAYVTAFGVSYSQRFPVWPTLIWELQRRPRPLTIWFAGCHIGTEAYYLAMCLLDAGLGDRVKIRVCDADPTRLKIARAGIYAEICVDLDVRMRRLSQAKRDRYFRGAETLPNPWSDEPSKRLRAVEVTDDVRELIEFTDPVWVPEHVEQADVIYLRNIWMHITGEEKRTLVRKLRDALPEDGLVAFRTAQFKEVETCMPRRGNIALYGRPTGELDWSGVQEEPAVEIFRPDYLPPDAG